MATHHCTGVPCVICFPRTRATGLPVYTIPFREVEHSDADAQNEIRALRDELRKEVLLRTAAAQRVVELTEELAALKARWLAPIEREDVEVKG